MDLNELKSKSTRGGLRRVPDGVVVQLWWLLGADDLVYLDANDTGQGHANDLVTGRIVAFTQSRVIQIDMKATPLPTAGVKPAPEGTVTAKTWSRSRLESISLHGTDQQWAAADESFPAETYVRLTYSAGRTAPLDVTIQPALGSAPRSPRPDRELVASLFSDLG
jgi:hypothetical protein